MGFNTIAFLLNDFMHVLKNSPKTVTWGVSHPPQSNDPRDLHMWREHMILVAKENNEPYVHSQALEVLPTFHAGCTTYLRAGGNCIEKLNVVRYSKTKEGKNTITLELPTWWNKKEDT